MKYADKTREQLVSELAGLHQRVAELEASAGEHKRADEELAGQRDHLEKLVGERTAELKALNWHLKQQITERERAEALNSFMDSAVDGFLLFDSELNWIDMNNRASEILGVKREEVIGKNIVKAVPDVEKTGRYDKYREVLKTGKPSSFDDVVPHPKFQKVHLAVKAFKVGDGLGIIGTDITERKRAEEALQVEKNKLQSVIDTMEYGLTIVDRDYNVIYQKELLRGTFGVHVGEKCYRAFEGRETVCDGCPVEQAFRDGKSHTSERKLVLPSGEVFFWENTASPISDAEGKIVSCLEVIRDITERKQAEETLRESEEKYKELAESITDVFFAFDGDLRYTYWNKASEKLTGVAAEDALGKHLYDIFPDSEMTKRAEKVYLKALRTQQAQSFVNEFQVGGKNYFFAVNAYPSKGGLSVFVKDITERKRAGEALQAEKNKLQSVIGAMEHGLSIVDKGHNILYQSKPSVMTGGYHPGEKCYRAYEARDTVCDGCPVEQAFKDGKPHTAERKVVAPSGEVFFLENTASPIRSAGGRIVSCVEVTRNVTERKRAEEKRQTILNTALDGFWLVNLEGRIIEVNDSYCKMVGYTREELLEMSIPDLEAVESPEDVAKRIKKIIEQGYDSFESRHRRKDGQIIDVEISVNYLDVGEGQFFVFARDITERKQMEEALQAEKNKLQSVIDAIEYGLSIQDKDYNIIYQSQPMVKTAGDHLGEKCYRAYEARDTVCDGCPVEQAFNDGKLHTSERKVLAPSGRVVFLEHTACPVRDAEGRIVSCLEIPRNITERKQMDEALRKERDKAQKYLDIAGVIIVAIDSEGKATLINRKGSEVLGYKAEEVIGQDWFDLVVPPRMKEDLQAVARKLLSGKIEPVEFYENPVLTKSGEERLIAWHNTVLRDDIGNIIGHLSSGEDITERKRADEAVRESEEKLRKMFESVTDGISVVDLDGIITEVNQRTLEMHGFGSRDEILGKSAFDLVDPADHKRVAANMRKALREGTVRGVEYTLLRADGSKFPAELGTSMLKDASGKAIGHITISRDITERQQAEEREEELQRELYLASRLAAVGELAAGVAHEMNNPLTGIMGFSERLLRKSDKDSTKKDVEIIHSEAQRLAKVVQNLLTFARQREPAKEYADINEIVQKTLELRAYELKSGNVEVALELAANLPQIMVDFHQIQEVFLNIILNAEQAMTAASGGGKLTIKTRPIKDYVRISFADDGPGIPAEHLDRVFNPFFTTKGERGGTGLGLSVCHGIVTEHGGRIYARSKPGSGATFLVDLPLTSRKIGESQIAPEKLSV